MRQVRADLQVHQRIVHPADLQVPQVTVHQAVAVAVVAGLLPALPQVHLQEVHQEAPVEAVVVEEDN